MATWTPAELDEIDTDHELRIAARRPDGTLRSPVTIWMVRVGGDVFVRAAHGAATRWNAHARAAGTGHVRVGLGIDHDVAFEPADPALNDAITAAYEAKYDGRYPRAYIEPVVSTESRGTTLRVAPVRETAA
jgi:hypothetical protein